MTMMARSPTTRHPAGDAVTLGPAGGRQDGGGADQRSEEQEPDLPRADHQVHGDPDADQLEDERPRQPGHRARAITPDATSASISRRSIPSSPRISAVCSPSAGAGRRTRASI